MSKNVGLISLGCPKNLVDSEIMLGLLEKAGYHLVNDPEKADILIVNTCGFIEDSKRESIETVIEMAGYKNNARAKHLIVTGCLPQRYKDELVSLFPEVDLFIGSADYHKIVSFIKRLDKKSKVSDKDIKHIISVPEYIHTAKTPRKVSTHKHAVYLKIAEGCFHGCSFCAIPLMRGKFRSRPIKDVVQEAKQLLRSGAKEINLIAQDTTAFGRDNGKDENLTELLKSLGALSGEKWIRLLYTYPQTFKKRIISAMREYQDICRYIDMPIQHIDDKVLYNMRRGRSEKLLRELISYIKDKMPEVALRTSIITGFPGETETQFKKLHKFIEEGWFDHVGVFAYSEEEGTAASKLKGHLSDKVKETRKKALMKAQKKVSKRKLKEKVGTNLKVLIDGPSEETDLLLQGRSEFQAPEIDGLVYINEGKAEPGEFYWVEITESYDYDLVGKVV